MISRRIPPLARKALGILCCCILWPFCPPDAGAHAPEALFFSPQTALRRNARQVWFAPFWWRVVQEEDRQPGFTPDGQNMPAQDAPLWRNLVAAAGKSQVFDTLRMVNGFFNRWAPVADSKAWKQTDYWTTPREFMRTRGGDCEDYAIAKYYALRFLHFPTEQLRIVIIREKDSAGVPTRYLHAVCAVLVNATWFILDNNSRPRDGIIPHTQYKDRWIPLFSMNENGIWEHAPDPLPASRSTGNAARP